MNNLQVISLNVGGEKLTTDYDTLKQVPYFNELIANGFAESAIVTGDKDSREYFIDRDGKAFSDIMHYLRTYEIREKDLEQLRVLESEAEFFKYNNMVIRINQTISHIRGNETYAVKELGIMFSGIEDCKIEPYKDQTSIVAAYKHRGKSSNDYVYKLVVKSTKK